MAVGEHPAVIEAPRGVDLSLPWAIIVTGRRHRSGVEIQHGTAVELGVLEQLRGFHQFLVDHLTARVGVADQLGELGELGVQLLRFGLKFDHVEFGQASKLQPENVIGLFGVDGEPLLQALAGLVHGVRTADHRDRGIDVEVDGHQTGHQVAPSAHLLQPVFTAVQHHRVAQRQERADQLAHRPPARYPVLVERNQTRGERPLQGSQGQ